MDRTQNITNETLRNEIFQLKKQLADVCTDNQQLKVQNRKLRVDILKRDKHIEALLDPRQVESTKKILYEKSASYVINMKQENDKLHREMLEKNDTIKTLEKRLQVTQVYAKKPAVTNEQIKEKLRKRNHSARPDLRRICGKMDGRGDQSACKRTRSMEICRHPLLAKAGNSQRSASVKSPLSEKYYSDLCSPLVSDLERIDDLFNIEEIEIKQSDKKYEKPHEEIEQLSQYFMDLLKEIKELKETNKNLQIVQNSLTHKRTEEERFDRIMTQLKTAHSSDSSILKNSEAYKILTNKTTENNLVCEGIGSKKINSNYSDHENIDSSKSGSSSTVSSSDYNSEMDQHKKINK